MVRNVYLRNRADQLWYGREKGGKFKFRPFRPLKWRLFCLVFRHCMACRWCPMQFGGARRSLGGPGWSPGIARGLPGCNRAQNEGFIKFGKRCFWPPGEVWGAPPYIIVRNKIPNGARQARNMLWDDDPAPFISGNHSHDRAPRRG